MAGFQKFPVPRALNFDAWAYNKKWIGNSVALFAGALLITIPFFRYNLTRSVFFSLFRIFLQELDLTLIPVTHNPQNQSNSEYLYKNMKVMDKST
jgi:hypothetical protein